jgi:hypothetical protein
VDTEQKRESLCECIAIAALLGCEIHLVVHGCYVAHQAIATLLVHVCAAFAILMCTPQQRSSSLATFVHFLIATSRFLWALAPSRVS